MDKKPISQETLEKLKQKARASLSSSSLKDQVQDEQLLEDSDIQKIGQLKQQGRRHSEISEEPRFSCRGQRSAKEELPTSVWCNKVSFQKEE